MKARICAEPGYASVTDWGGSTSIHIEGRRVYGWTGPVNRQPRPLRPAKARAILREWFGPIGARP